MAPAVSQSRRYSNSSRGSPRSGRARAWRGVSSCIDTAVERYGQRSSCMSSRVLYFLKKSCCRTIFSTSTKFSRIVKPVSDTTPALPHTAVFIMVLPSYSCRTNFNFYISSTNLREILQDEVLQLQYSCIISITSTTVPNEPDFVTLTHF